MNFEDFKNKFDQTSNDEIMQFFQNLGYDFVDIRQKVIYTSAEKLHSDFPNPFKATLNINERRCNIVKVQSSITHPKNGKRLSDISTKYYLLMRMKDKLFEFMSIVDIEYHDGTKCTNAVLNVVVEEKL